MENKNEVEVKRTRTMFNKSAKFVRVKDDGQFEGVQRQIVYGVVTNVPVTYDEVVKLAEEKELKAKKGVARSVKYHLVHLMKLGYVEYAK